LAQSDSKFVYGLRHRHH